MKKIVPVMYIQGEKSTFYPSPTFDTETKGLSLFSQSHV